MGKFIILLMLFLLLGTSSAFGDWQRVLSDIEDGIDQDESIGSYDLEMHYRLGSVILKGRVASEPEVSRIEDIARSVQGVDEVTNWIDVDPELSPLPDSSARAMPKLGPTDRKIEEYVREALLSETGVGTSLPQVSVSGGKVTFRGDRKNFREIDKILAITLMIEGVTGIESDMTVKGKPYPKFKL